MFIQSIQELNQLLLSNSKIKANNKLRPRIYIYSDFGGGSDTPLSDEQTVYELASLGWKTAAHSHIYVNDSAPPLNPSGAGAQLAATFPYQEERNCSDIHTIVVHVIDPGVSNVSTEGHNHLRSIVLRKDGVLFIGPDNGTLSGVLPKHSIETIWAIDQARVEAITGINLEVGGTFHGRDLFSELAFRIASGQVQPKGVGIPYLDQDLFHRCSCNTEGHRIEFQEVEASRIFLNKSENGLFSSAFLLGVIQSPLEASQVRTQAKTLFVKRPENEETVIAIINFKTNNVYIGPNNGLGTSFFVGYGPADYLVVETKASIIEQLSNNEELYSYLIAQPDYMGQVCKINLINQKSKTQIRGRIFIDAYGNIKTTITSDQLSAFAKRGHKRVCVEINGVTHRAKTAKSFLEVKESEVFIYAGSSGAFGPNPKRQNRLIEVSSNGIYGKFGIDFFKQSEVPPQSGDAVTFVMETLD